MAPVHVVIAVAGGAPRAVLGRRLGRLVLLEGRPAIVLSAWSLAGDLPGCCEAHGEGQSLPVVLERRLVDSEALLKLDVV